MELHWESKKLYKQLTDEEYLTRAYDAKVAKKTAQRLIELEEAPSYAKLPKAPRYHPIKEGGKLIYFTGDVPRLGDRGRGDLRLAFIPYGEHDPAHVETITEVKILKLTNETHKG